MDLFTMWSGRHIHCQWMAKKICVCVCALSHLIIKSIDTQVYL